MTTPVYLLQEFCRGTNPEIQIHAIEKIGRRVADLPDSDTFQICHIISGKEVDRTRLLSPDSFRPLDFEKKKKLLAEPDQHSFEAALESLEDFIKKDAAKHKGNGLTKPVLCVLTDHFDVYLVIDAIQFRLGDDCLLSKLILVYRTKLPPGAEDIFDDIKDIQTFRNMGDDAIRTLFSGMSTHIEKEEGAQEIEGILGGDYFFNPRSKPLGSAGEKVVLSANDGHKQLALGLYKAQWKDDQGNPRVSESTGSKREGRIKRVRNIIKVGKASLQEDPEEAAHSICWSLDIIDDADDRMFPENVRELLQKQLRGNDKLLSEKLLGVIMPAIPENFLYPEMDEKRPPKTLKFLMCPEFRETWADGKLPPKELRRKLCKHLARTVAIFETRGLRHTDLSWNNVLADDKNGDVYIIDIDSCHQGDLQDETAVKGTPMFLAPELAEGEGGLPTFFSDRFALAKLIYGILMFDESDIEGPTSSRFFMGRVVDGKLHRPDEEDVGRFASAGPKLSELFKKAFQVGWDEPGRRPSASDWADELRSGT